MILSLNLFTSSGDDNNACFVGLVGKIMIARCWPVVGIISLNFRGRCLINTQLLHANSFEEVWVPLQLVRKGSPPELEKTPPLILLLSNHISPPLFAVSIRYLYGFTRMVSCRGNRPEKCIRNIHRRGQFFRQMHNGSSGCLK